MELEAIQAALRDAGHDGWLFYDHHHRDPIAAHILGLDEKAHITRRWYYFVPAEGGVSHFNYLRDNVLLTSMYFRLLPGCLARLPRLITRRTRD